MNIIKQITILFSKIYRIFTRQQRHGSAILFVFLVLGSLLEMLGVSVIVPLVQVILMPEQIMQNPLYRPIWQVLHIQTTDNLVICISAGAIGIYILKNGYMSFLSYYKNRFYRNVEKQMSMKLMNSYLEREYTFHINTNSATLLRSIIYDISGVSATLASIFTIVMESMSAIFIIVALFATDFTMALTLALSAMVALLLIVATFHRTMKTEGKQAVVYSRLCLKAVNEAFNGIKDVMVTKRQTFFANSFSEAINGKNRSNAIKNFASECPAYVIEAICITAFIIMLCMKSLTGQNGEEFVADAAAFAIAAFRILPSVGKITNNYNIMTYYQAMVDDVYRNIHEAAAYEESQRQGISDFNENGSNCADSSKKACDGDFNFTDKITLEHITWKYPNAEKDVIKDLNMTIYKGQAIGIIGASGAGKTTLMDMILGLLPTRTGRIAVDDADIKNIPNTWSRIIGYVPQSVYLTDDTIRNNVAFGIAREQIKDEDVWTALEQAQLRDFVKTLPLKLDTIVGERGIKFSGGQRQRVAIARALYYDPDILVLDEATSALDNETENAVMEAIDSLQGHKTLIIVAHRLTTIASCDAVYEIVDGKAVLQAKQE